MKKSIYVILGLLFAVIGYNTLKQPNYHPDALNGFAIVNKSFNRDLKISLRQYKSYEEFVKPKNIPFYMVIPQNEFELFNKEFSKAQASGEIKKLPNFITEEEVLQKCSASVYEKSKTMGGWHVQQLIKLCFGKTGLAKNYLTLDSDTYFTKTMDSNILFEGTNIKTLSQIKKRNNEDEFKFKDPNLYHELRVIKEKLSDNTKSYSTFVFGHATWSSDNLHLLENYLKEQHNFDFADAINLMPWEMNWNAIFLLTHHPEKFIPIERFFTIIHLGDENDYDRCVPSKGDYFTYGISYQHSIEKNDYYINKCGGFKTLYNTIRLRVKRFKNTISQFFKNSYYNLIGIK